MQKRAAAVLLTAPVVTTAILMMPRIAAACSVCTAGRDEENQTAFLLSTLFMSILPLAAIGSIIFFIYRRIQKVEAEQEARAGAARRGATAGSGGGVPSASVSASAQ